MTAEIDPPGFLWDLRLDESEFRRIVRGSEDERLWAIRRLLEYGEWGEIWTYLTLEDVERALPRIRLRSPELQSFWEEAVSRWRTSRASTSA